MKIRTVFIIIGISTLISNTFVILYTWFLAFLNNGKVTIAINNYNEMLLELIFIPILTVIALWSVYQLLRRKRKLVDEHDRIAKWLDSF